MPKQIQYLCAAITGALLAPPIFAAQQIDLNQALNYALAQNRSLVLSDLDRRSARLGITSAEAEFRLSIQPEIAVNAADDDGDSSTVGLNVSRRLRTGTELSARASSDSAPGIEGRQEFVQIEVQQPLFRFGGRLLNEEPVVAAASALQAAQRRYELQKIDLIVEVVRSYEEILRLEKQLSADEKSLERAQALYRSTRAKEALGRSSRIDTLRVELQRGQALSRLESDRERLGSAQQAFAELLGFSSQWRFVLQPTKLLEVEVPPLPEAMEIAFANRLDYAQAIQDYRDARRGVLIAGKQLQPDLRLVGRYQRLSDPSDPDGGLNLNEQTWFLGLAADTDFNRVRERTALRQSQLGATSSDQFLRVLELRIARELQQRILAYRRAFAELKILQRNLRHAEARLDLARRLFEIGRGDNFSVTDAEEAFLLAEGNLLSGRASASISAYELLRTLGTLTEPPPGLKPEPL